MENTSSNTVSNLPNREKDGPSKDLIVFLKNELQKEAEIPWWFGELDRMSEAINKINNGAKLSELTSGRDNKSFDYPSSTKEALLGQYTGKLKYSILRQERYVQFLGKNCKLPNDPDKAIDQLAVSQWSVFGETGGGGVIRQFQKVRDFLSVDLPTHMKEIFVSDPEKKATIISGLKRAGEAIRNWDYDTLTVQLQEVYWSNELRKPMADTVLSIRVSETVSGENFVTARRMAFDKNNDERKYKIPKDVASDFDKKFVKVFK